MIQMKKEDCTICNGSSYVNPYPYRQRKKCDHRWSMGSFMERYNTTGEEAHQAALEHERWVKALKTQIKDNQ